MPTIEVPQVKANDEITFEGTNAGPNAIADVVNGQLDDTNIASLSGTKIVAGTVPVTAMTTDSNPETRTYESSGDFVASGLVWSATTGLNGAMTAGVAYVTGKRLSVPLVSSYTFTASKDTYIYVSNTGTISYNPLANGAATPALPANNLLLAVVVTSGAAVTSVSDRRIKSVGVRTWWEEIGRTTVTSPSSSISLTSLPNKKYLRVVIMLLSTGPSYNIGALLRLNDDTSGNYTKRSADNYGTPGAPVTAQTSLSISAATTINSLYSEIDVFNLASYEKMYSGTENINVGNGSTNSNIFASLSGKWVNTSTVINRIDVINNGTSQYAIGSELIVLGHD